MFVPGQNCRRHQDIHEIYGGQRQGGISTPSGHPLIFIFTGESGETYGYRDEFRPDGTFWYTGEGQTGDMEMIRGKWKAVILCHLNDGIKRFNQLQRIIPGVSQKVLMEKLYELEEDGLILKKDYGERRPKVEYSLTERGLKLFPALDEIQRWAEEEFIPKKETPDRE